MEEYFSALRLSKSTGAATDELSTYLALGNLLNAVGATLRPKVFCVVEMANQGAGHPDIGLFAASQVQRGRPRRGQSPERGVIEVKGPGDDAWLTAEGDQVSGYWDRYRLVLVTNTRDFVLLGEDADGRPARLETFRLAESEDEFDALIQRPRSFARKVGAGLGEYLCRAMSHPATIVEPRDLAWLLASYARDGLARVEAAGDAPSLVAVRSALEDALGVKFEGRPRRGVLQIDAGSDALLRCVLSVGAVVAEDAASGGQVQLARSDVGAARPCAALAVLPAFQSQPA